MVKAIFTDGSFTRAYGLTQWDYGQTLEIHGLGLPKVVEIHFAVQDSPEPAIIKTGNTVDGVTTAGIPDSILKQPKNVVAYVYVADENSGKTVKTIFLPVKQRQKPEIMAPDKEEREMFHQVVAEVNAAAGRAEEAESRAEAWVHGKDGYPERDEDNAKYYSGRAARSKEAAEAAAGNAADDCNRAAEDRRAVAEMKKALDQKIWKDAPGISRIASGKTVCLMDSSEKRFAGIRQFGHTAQGGTPTPGKPVELVSVGDKGWIEISVSGGSNNIQTLVYPTPSGLPGLPASSGGNYADENGKQWITDEVDFGRGVLIKRVDRIVLDGTDVKFTPNEGGTFWNLPQHSSPRAVGGADLYSNYFPHNSFGVNANYEFVWTSPNLMKLYFETAEELNGFVKEKYEEGNPVIIMYRTEPVETPVSDEELAAYRALHTNTPTTTIVNDEGCYMEVGYIVDTELYIEQNYVPKEDYEALEQRVTALENAAKYEQPKDA